MHGKGETLSLQLALYLLCSSVATVGEQLNVRHIPVANSQAQMSTAISKEYLCRLIPNQKLDESGRKPVHILPLVSVPHNGGQQAAEWLRTDAAGVTSASGSPI